MDLFQLSINIFLIYYGYQGRARRKRSEWTKITFSDICLVIGLSSLIATVFGGN